MSERASGRPGWMVGLNVVLAVLFGWAAWMQRNDIDPAVYYNASGLDALLWLLFYLAIGVLLLVVLRWRLPRWLLVLAAVACVVEMVRTGPGLWSNVFGSERFNMMQVSMSAEDPRVELSREFFGALIALGGVVLLGWESRRLYGGWG